MYMYDWSQPATVQAWANGVANAVKKGGFDGVFIDGYDGWHKCQPKAPSDNPAAHATTAGAAAMRQPGAAIAAPHHLSGCPSLLGGTHTAVGNKTVNASAYLSGLWYDSGQVLP